MRMLQAVARQPLGVTTGFVGASALFLVVFGLAFASGRVLANHDGSGNVHACVNNYTGQARIMLPGRPPNCTAQEMLVEWAGSGVAVDLATLQAEVSALQAQVPDCLSTEGVNAVFEGCNVHVRNGLDDTETTNATGNLIVGYNENDNGRSRVGSHNIVVGSEHGYSNYGGFVAGFSNVISGQYTSVSGGFLNIATGDFSSVSGGFDNEAAGVRSSVSGGNNRNAPGPDDWVAGALGVSRIAQYYPSSRSSRPGHVRGMSSIVDARPGAIAYLRLSHAMKREHKPKEADDGFDDAGSIGTTAAAGARRAGGAGAGSARRLRFHTGRGAIERFDSILREPLHRRGAACLAGGAVHEWNLARSRPARPAGRAGTGRAARTTRRARSGRHSGTRGATGTAG